MITEYHMDYTSRRSNGSSLLNMGHTITYYEIMGSKRTEITEQRYHEDGLIQSLLYSKELREQGQVHAWSFNQ